MSRTVIALALVAVVGVGSPAHAHHPVSHHGDNPSAAAAIRSSSTPSGSGYHTMDAAGGVFTHGDARYFGSVPDLRRRGLAVGAAEVADLSTTSTGEGYWVLDDAGGIFTFGDARFFGSMPQLRRQGHAIGPGRLRDLAPTSTDQGYYLLDEHGGVFTFGDARFLGSVPGLRQQGRSTGTAGVVSITPVPGRDGYWILDEHGGVFAFGDAPYLGSLPERGVAAQAVALEPAPGGAGYWVATRDGGIHAFGGATFHGSALGMTWGRPVADFSASPHGTGYWVLLDDGTVLAREPAPPFQSAVAPVSADELGASWRPGCPVSPTDLRMLTVTHWGFDGAARTGRVVVHADHVDTMTAVMRDLYAVRFPVEHMEPVAAFGGDDDASMAANNTSAFNCRTVAGTSRWSEHAYGRAVDINPVQNPYVAGSTVEPPAGRAYLDRNARAPGMIRAEDAVVRAFTARGWGWGGHWPSIEDYQHFSAGGR